MNFCDCINDGFCPRYGHEMYGRNREICRGVNVDAGTAAQFRLLWKAESTVWKGAKRHLTLRNSQCPGDVLVMTAAVHSLHRTYPGKYTTSVDTLYPEVFLHNPDVVDVPGELVEMHYPAIHRCDSRGIHFMEGWCEFLGTALGVDVPLATNRPHLYFDDVAPVEDYWVVCSHTKDLTCKDWGHDSYQEVVRRLPDVRFMQVGSDGRTLDGACNFVGKTSLRQLFDIVRRARGVLCGVSLPMHIAAALEKPCIVVAGGREPVQWNAYPRQHYLHTVGTLDCCADGGCWKSRVAPMNDGSPLDSSLCERPAGSVPECMSRIMPNEVVGLIDRLATSAASESCRTWQRGGPPVPGAE